MLSVVLWGLAGFLWKVLDQPPLRARDSALWFLSAFVPVGLIIVVRQPLPEEIDGRTVAARDRPRPDARPGQFRRPGGLREGRQGVDHHAPRGALPARQRAAGDPVPRRADRRREALGIALALARAWPALDWEGRDATPTAWPSMRPPGGRSHEVIAELLRGGVVLGDGGYLIELERRGYVDSGSGREAVGTGKGSGQFTPEVAIENPDALRGLHREFLDAGSQVLQALTFFGTREKLGRAGYGAQTEAINAAAVRIAREVAGGRAPSSPAASRARSSSSARGRPPPGTARPARRADPPAQGRGRGFPDPRDLLPPRRDADRAGVCGRGGLPVVATMSFRPLITACTDGHSPAECAGSWPTAVPLAVGANCEQEPSRMLPLLRADADAAVVPPLAAQPAAFRTTDAVPLLHRQPAFPDDLETIQVSRGEFVEFGRRSRPGGDRLRRRLLRLQCGLHPRPGEGACRGGQAGLDRGGLSS